MNVRRIHRDQRRSRVGAYAWCTTAGQVQSMLAVIVGLSWVVPSLEASDKIRLMHVDSYHREYAGSQLPIQGFCEALLKFGYLDTQAQVETCIKEDAVESSSAIIHRLWLDSKRKAQKRELVESTASIVEQVNAFQPQLLFLSDENATNYIGTQFLDTKVPVVFWGLKNTPLKYGLVESIERPGHNVTGVYAVGFYEESLGLLKKLAPQVTTFAILSDESEVGRSHLKAVQNLAMQGMLPLQLVEVVSTYKFQEWKQRVLELQDQVGAFFIASINSLEDERGMNVPREEVVRWYLANIRIPEAAPTRSYIENGLLCSADYGRRDQGREAVIIAHDILSQGTQPAIYPVRNTKRSTLVVNRERAEMLGITLTPEMGIEEIIENSTALQQLRR